MDAFLALVAVVAGLVAVLVVFDLAALRLGVDSRDPIGDDHRRPLA